MAQWLGWILGVVLLSACAPAPLPIPAAPTPAPGGVQARSAAAVRAERVALRGQRVTVQGVVTSVQAEGVTLQSEGAALAVEPTDGARVAQWVVVTGRVEEPNGALTLVAVEEWLVEEQVPLPAPAPLTLAPEQESLFVQSGPATVGAGSTLLLPGGVRLPFLPPDGALAPEVGTRVDGARGVLLLRPQGWLLAVAHARDLVLAPPEVAPCAVQGSGRQSPWRGERVETGGVVVAAWTEGVGGAFIQAEACDRDPQSSDALFVVLPPDQSPPAAGDRVRLRGTVAEHYGRTQLVVEAGGLLVEASGQPLPAPLRVEPPADAPVAYFEAREGMLVTLPEGVAVGPTTRFGEFAVVPPGVPALGGHLLRASEAAERVLFVGAGGAWVAGAIAVGDRVADLVGPLDFTFGTFKVQPLVEPRLAQQPLPTPPAAPALPPGAWSIATLNTENLFDPLDTPSTVDEDSTLTPEALAARLDKLAATLAGPLGLPTIVALQEVETLAVLEQLAAHPRLAGQYAALLLEGNDPRGIDQGLLVANKRVAVVEVAGANRCARLAAPGAGMGGACAPGEALLFARPPLVARLRLDGQQDLYVINCHFKSKADGEEASQPRRNAQARFVAELVAQLRTANPQAEVIVLGDLNDHEASQTLGLLHASTPLTNLWDTVPPNERYSYIFQGISQTLDHILVTEGLQSSLIHFAPIHLNADFPATLHEDAATLFRTSDHDPLLAIFGTAVGTEVQSP